MLISDTLSYKIEFAQFILKYSFYLDLYI